MSVSCGTGTAAVESEGAACRLEAVFLYGLHTFVNLWALAHFVPFWSHPTHATKGYRQWCGCPQPLAPLVSPRGGLGGPWIDEANYTAFLLGTPSLQAAGCSTQPILKLPRAWVVLCILHLTTAMGRLLEKFVDREARSVTPALCQDLQVLLSERRAGWSVYGSASPDGEETANFFDAWPDIAKCLGIWPSTAKYKAIANMWDLLQALYCTYQGPDPLNCAAVARDFRRHCTVRKASWYLLSLDQDVDTMLQNIKPFGLAMFSGDIAESINRFLKHGHNEHSNRGRGGLSGGGGGRGVGSLVVGHPQGGQCASAVHDMVVCVL